MDQDIRPADHTERKKERRYVYQNEIGMQVRYNHSLSDLVGQTVQAEEPEEAMAPDVQPEQHRSAGNKCKTV